MTQQSDIENSSFAYGTIKDRLPIILSKIADIVYRKKNEIKNTKGQEATEDLKALAGAVSKLRNEVQTGKPVIPLVDSRPDVTLWNNYLQEVTQQEGEPPSWFISPWLYVECYMYRRVQQAVEQTFCLKDMDVFEEQKQTALSDSSSAIHTLLQYLWTVVQDLEAGNVTDIHKLFVQFLQVALWGNRCDLSISAGMTNAQTSCPLDQVDDLKSFILIDNKEDVWSCLSERPAGRVDIILDNAGFELMSDLCLAELLLSSKLATSIHFHGKSFPWFVSDVTIQDFQHTQRYLQSSNSLYTNFFAQRWQKRLEEGTWNYKTHDYWTLPFDFSEMKGRSPDLYKELGQSGLIFLKGDLNYRKLVGDRNWPTTTPFEESLRGFHPAPLCTLRALKADVVTGLQPGQKEEVEGQDKRWMVNGSWAVISFCGQRQP